MSIALHPVNPSDIQSELNTIWESLNTKNTARASLFNLIFLTKKNLRTAYFHQVAQKVIEKFPSRVLFVMIDEDKSTSSLKTEVSILKSNQGEFDIACDYIQIEADAGAKKKIGSIILPQLLSDLPVYLLLAQDLSDKEPLCPELQPFASRLIFDSETTSDFSFFAKSVLGHYENTQCDIADLNWARIEDWRDLFSMVFYSKERLEQIRRMQKITLTYNAQETPFFCHTKIQSIYLQAWLACQLEWKFEVIKKEKNLLIFHYTNGSDPLQIILSPEKNDQLPPGIILTADLQTTQQERFLFERNRKELHQMILQFSDATSCALPLHHMFRKTESGHSLVKEIGHKGTSQHYLNVLKLIQNLQVLGPC